MTAPAASPHDLNQSALCREFDRLYAALTGGAITTPRFDGPRAPTLDRIGQFFVLTSFERDLLLLCAACELETRFADACATANGDERSVWPTLSMAFATLAAPHWTAIGPDGPLRYWCMIDVSPGTSLVRSPLRIDERILHFLIGVPGVDSRLEPIVQPIESHSPVNPAPYRTCAARVAEHWASAAGVSTPVLLVGKRSSDQRLVAEEICRALGQPCFSMRASDIPARADERAQIARLWTREALLTGAMLFIRTSAVTDPQEPARLAAFLAAAWGPIAVEVRELSELEPIEGLRIPVPPMTIDERRSVWVESLGEAAASMNGSLERIADYFDLDAPSIRLAGGIVKETAEKHPSSDVGKIVWQECRIQARRAFEGLARRIQPHASWDDLILPDLQKDTLRQIVAHVRQRSKVNGEWGFGERYSQGLGVTALFAGASGTGKTMAAEVVAAELDLDLFQIDLSSVVSKYIGETEKNLRRVFDAADESGAVLLFDEADALFGKRSEVKDSHDRYANLEISYLLQRMESYHGLAILTTNMKHALDTAFLRRIRFVLQFPFPGAPERNRIWQRVFPARTPLARLDYDHISQLNIAGGIIRNIALHAAFLAADEHSPVAMEHIMRAAKVEYAKLDRPLTPSETGGWA